MNRFLYLGALFALVMSGLLSLSRANPQTGNPPFQERERIIIKKSDFNPPVWIKRAKAKKGLVQLGKRFEDDDDWLRGFTVGILNASNKPVTHVSIEMLFRHETELRQPAAAWFVEYGVNPLAYDRASEMPASVVPNVMPGGEIELAVDDKAYEQLMLFLRNAGFLNSIQAVEVRVNSVGFSDGTIWSSGKMLRRNADTPGKWSPITDVLGVKSLPRSPPRLALKQIASPASTPFTPSKFTNILYNLNARQDPPIECFSYVGTLPRCGFSDSWPDSCRMHDLEQTFSPPFNEKTEWIQTQCQTLVGGNLSNNSCGTTTFSIRSVYCDPCPNLECYDQNAVSYNYCSGCPEDYIRSGNCCYADCSNPPVCDAPDHSDTQQCCCADSNGNCRESPVLIDVDGNGFKMSAIDEAVSFDLNADGQKEKLSWTAAGSDDSCLVLDRNGNGLIDTGRELFGNFTFQPSGAEKNGFLALAEFDKPAKAGNADGYITANDGVFSLLRLWRDANHNGMSEPGELLSLQAVGLKTLELAFKTSKHVDQYGNRFRYRAKIKDTKGRQVGRWAWDVFLIVNHKSE